MGTASSYFLFCFDKPDLFLILCQVMLWQWVSGYEQGKNNNVLERGLDIQQGFASSGAPVTRGKCR